jgi:FkbM family methyltransferase
MVDLMNIPSLRSLAWRLGRRLYQFARHDLPNEPSLNGEYWLIQKIIEQSASDASTFVDIGANKGEWSSYALSVLKAVGIKGRVFACEPTESTFAYLSERIGNYPSVRVLKVALSEQSGETDFFVVGDLAGTNSLNPIKGARVERVRTQRFDDFCAEYGLENILFVKSDTEGHDMSVLRGANHVLGRGQVDAWQFEYNHRWVAAGATLKNVFDFIEGKPYCLGKLHREGIEIYEQWHPELERFFEGNYVLIKKGGFAETLGKRVRFDGSNIPHPLEALS